MGIRPPLRFFFDPFDHLKLKNSLRCRQASEFSAISPARRKRIRKIRKNSVNIRSIHLSKSIFWDQDKKDLTVLHMWRIYKKPAAAKAAAGFIPIPGSYLLRPREIS